MPSYRKQPYGQYISLEALCTLLHVAEEWTPYSSVSARLANALRDHGLLRNIALELLDFASISLVMQTCELIAFLPRRLAERNGSGFRRLRVVLDITAAEVFERCRPRFKKSLLHVRLGQRASEAASQPERAA